MIQAKCCWSDSGAGSAALLLAGVVLLAGMLLFAGFLTPAVGGMVALGGLGIGLGWLPAGSAALFNSNLSVTFGATILLAIIVLGPGAFSVDARLFGRREIIIPPRTPHAG